MEIWPGNTRPIVRGKKAAPIAAPWALLLTTYLIYQGAVTLLGSKPGYLAGFLFYWIAWRFGFSVWILGLDGVVARFRDRQRPSCCSPWATCSFNGGRSGREVGMWNLRLRETERRSIHD